MIERQPSKTLAFYSGMEISSVRPTISAHEIIDQEATLQRRNTTFNEIQTVLFEATSNNLPDNLVDQFGLSALKWQQITRHNGLAGIFVGAEKSKSDVIGLQDALSVIELRSQAQGERYNYNSTKVIRPQDIRVSGVMMDTEGNIRTAGCLFTSLDFLTEPAHLTSAYISVSSDELPPVNFGSIYHDITDQYNSLSKKIPTEIHNGMYTTAALITEAQVNQTENHERALELRGNIRTESMVMGLRRGGDYPNPGFQLFTTDTSHTLRFDPEFRGTSRYGLEFNVNPASPTWEVSLPIFLES